MFFLILITPILANAQDLMDILDAETPESTEFITASFKGTRIINGHSIENRKEGTLEFLISHRFGKISDGVDQLFGLDDSNIRFALEYALTDYITVGFGRSSFEKTLDGFAKYKLLKQSVGQKKMPISVSIFGSIARKTIKDYNPENKPDFKDRLFYTSQILIARKFNNDFSLQISPTYIHRNSVRIVEDPHDFFALGAGLRYKMSTRVSVNVEYFHNFNPLHSINSHNAFAIAVDIETGGHVFQLMLSNANTMIEKAFITETTSDFFNGDIHFGFNISRAFHLKKHKIRDNDEESEW
ncbi:MAG TPA: DUF5777 family beta-barrel protein [Flavobacteriaceae bacterium]|nr:DUF5777 family beta-barrel protein [Flavobacteriaceae bacterium]